MPLAKGWSAERLLVSDPEQHTAECVQKEVGPDGFAVSGNLIVLPNEVRGDITIYRDGRPILHKSTGDAYVYDVALHGGLLYVLEGVYVNADQVTKLQVYSVINGGRKLTRLRTHELTLGDNSSDMELHFVGDNLIASSSEGGSVLAEGPGPFPDGATYDLQTKTASIQPADGTPAVLFHGHDILGLDLLATDDAFVWYRVEDMVGGDYVYRVPRSGSARIRAYRPADRHGAGTRDLVVDGGLVHALSMTSHMAAAQVLLLGPVP